MSSELQHREKQQLGERRSRRWRRSFPDHQGSMLRLDALTIAGLTGTHVNAHSPARSDATLGSIQDSEKGSGGGSSILSDELGDIEFTDEEDEEVETITPPPSLRGGRLAPHDGEGSRTIDSRSSSGGGSRYMSGREGEAAAASAAAEKAVSERYDGLAVEERASAVGGVSSRSLAPGPYRSSPPLSSPPSSAAAGGGGDRSAGVSAATLARTTSSLSSPSHGGDVESASKGAWPMRGDAPAGAHAVPAPLSSATGQVEDRYPYRANRTASSKTTNSNTSGLAHSSGGATTAVASTAVSGGESGRGVSPRAGGAVPTVTCKILVVGNAKCGKSSIISRFVSDRFSADYNSTVGADYAKKDVSLEGGRQVRLQLWDIAGQDRFAKLTRAYFRRAKGAVVVCDVTREGTFDAIVRWKEEIDLWCQNEGCELPVYLFANKCDLLTEVQDSFLAGARMEKTCREAGFSAWHITSAKRGDNIHEAMTKLLEDALEIERRRNRGTKEGGAQSNSTESSRDAKGMAFQLSSDGARGGGYMAGQRSCCA